MERVITYNTAVLAKEKGYNISKKYNNYHHGMAFYKNMELQEDENIGGGSMSLFEDIYDAPTKEELKTWLRKEHNIDVTVSVHGEIDLYVKDSSLLKTYTARVDNWNVQWSIHDGTGLVMPEHYHFEGSNYNDAFEQGLYKALELI